MLLWDGGDSVGLGRTAQDIVLKPHGFSDPSMRFVDRIGRKWVLLSCNPSLRAHEMEGGTRPGEIAGKDENKTD